MLAGDEGIEPPQEASKTSALPLCKSPIEMEQAAGIEPAWPVWKTGTLPLSYACFFFFFSVSLFLSSATNFSNLSYALSLFMHVNPCIPQLFELG